MGDGVGFSHFAEIEHREPVLREDMTHLFPNEEMLRQWQLISEAVKREILVNPSARRELLAFCATPVSESLPEEMLTQLSSVDDRIAKLALHYQTGIEAYLRLPQVPDELITPDITHAKELLNPQRIISNLVAAYGDDREMFEERLQVYVREGRFVKGMTRVERNLVARRCAFARDVKMLSLGAELMETNGELHAEDGEINLPSGINIIFNPGEDQAVQDLLNPMLWEKRKQLHDRVYEINVNGKVYILKEKKTAKHTNTKRHGHVEGRTAKEEFEIANSFCSNPTPKEGNIEITRERPLGCVTFPDGYQCTLFAFEENLSDYTKAEDLLAQAIERHPEQFREEYDHVQKMIPGYLKDRTVSIHGRLPESPLITLARKSGLLKQPHPDRFSFADFARVKAHRLINYSQNRLNDDNYAHGYQNSDDDGYAFRVHENGEVGLEIVGFDFEYFKPISSPLEGGRGEQGRQERLDFERKTNLDFQVWNNGDAVTRFQAAAHLALIDSEVREQDKKE